MGEISQQGEWVVSDQSESLERFAEVLELTSCTSFNDCTNSVMYHYLDVSQVSLDPPAILLRSLW
jgi:hypothetical protein